MLKSFIRKALIEKIRREEKVLMSDRSMTNYCKACLLWWVVYSHFCGLWDTVTIYPHDHKLAISQTFDTKGRKCRSFMAWSGAEGQRTPRHMIAITESKQLLKELRCLYPKNPKVFWKWDEWSVIRDLVSFLMLFTNIIKGMKNRWHIQDTL